VAFFHRNARGDDRLGAPLHGIGHGIRTSTRNLLAPIYDWFTWFTEGLDAPDLAEARVLLV
jgi:hypothetical protein